MPLSTQVYKWVPANCWGNLTKCGEVTCDGLASHPGEVEILLATSCYRNRDKLRQLSQSWFQGFTFLWSKDYWKRPLTDRCFTTWKLWMLITCKPRSGCDSYRVNENIIPVLAVGWNWVHGLVQPPYSSVWCGATREDNRCLPWPVSVVWSRQEASVSSMGKTSWHRAYTTFDVQMVPRLEHISWCSLNFG